MSQAAQSTTRQESATVAAPRAGQAVNVAPATRMALEFDPGSANFERSGNSLVITADNGGTVIVTDFFVTDGQPLPQFVLVGAATAVAGEEVLKQLNPTMDISTAAGPSASSSSSGAGEYADNSGDLMGGVDKMGSLGTEYWDRATEAREYLQSSALPADAGAVTGAGGPGPDPVTGPSWLDTLSVTLSDVNTRSGAQDTQTYDLHFTAGSRGVSEVSFGDDFSAIRVTAGGVKADLDWRVDDVTGNLIGSQGGVEKIVLELGTFSVDQNTGAGTVTVTATLRSALGHGQGEDSVTFDGLKLVASDGRGGTDTTTVSLAVADDGPSLSVGAEDPERYHFARPTDGGDSDLLLYFNKSPSSVEPDMTAYGLTLVVEPGADLTGATFTINNTVIPLDASATEDNPIRVSGIASLVSGGDTARHEMSPCEMSLWRDEADPSVWHFSWYLPWEAGNTYQGFMDHYRIVLTDGDGGSVTRDLHIGGDGVLHTGDAGQHPLDYFTSGWVDTLNSLVSPPISPFEAPSGHEEPATLIGFAAGETSGHENVSLVADHDTLAPGHEDGNTAQPGDILALSAHNHADVLGNGNNTITGFESLLLDMTDSHADSMALNDLLGVLNSLRGDANSGNALILKGDAGDTITGLTGNAAHTDVTIQGVEGTFNHYVVDDNNGEQVNLYIQNMLTLG